MAAPNQSNALEYDNKENKHDLALANAVSGSSGIRSVLSIAAPALYRLPTPTAFARRNQHSN